MRFGLYVLGAVTASVALVVVGCDGDTNTNSAGGSSNSGSSSSGDTASSSSSGSSGMGGSGGAGGGMMTSSSSSSSSGTPGTYADCPACTNNGSGAYKAECKDAADECFKDTDCTAIFDCSFAGCNVDAEGGCCTLACAMGKPQAAQDLYLALDKCIYCDTCKTYCNEAPVDATGYCASISGTMACP